MHQLRGLCNHHEAYTCASIWWLCLIFSLCAIPFFCFVAVRSTADASAPHEMKKSNQPPALTREIT